MKTTKKKMAATRLDQKEYEKLERLAEATARSRSSLIRQLIRLAEIGDNYQIRLKTTHSKGSGDKGREADDACN